MIFRDPAWLALLPVVALAGWVWRGLQLQRPLRAGFVLLVILLLMRPQWQRFAGGMDLWVLLDRSASTEALIDQGLPEWRQLLERGKPGSQDRLHFVDYASEVVPQESNAGGHLRRIGRQQSDAPSGTAPPAKCHAHGFPAGRCVRGGQTPRPVCPGEKGQLNRSATLEAATRPLRQSAWKSLCVPSRCC